MPADLHSLCALFDKRAELKNDMVKRIFLSVIPAVSGKSEMYMTGGVPSYQLLKSAAHGANDLVKFGTRACVHEMSYYGDVSQYKGAPRLTKEHILQNYKGLAIDTGNFPQYIVRDAVKAALRKAEDASTNPDASRHSAKANEFYNQALKLCVEGFNDSKAWDPAFGGRSWGKIASTLFSINQNIIQLKQNRRESAERPRATHNKDYLTEEIELMKHQVVLMNVFDGLAHNTGGIVEKLVNEERKERENIVDLNPELHSWEKKQMFQRLEEHETEDFQTIKRMMDAKELTNPLAVYKTILPEIKKSPQRKLFEDWETKLERHPDYKNTKSDYSDELEVVKMKKSLLEMLRSIEEKLNQIVAWKDKLLAEDTGSNRVAFSGAVETLLYRIRAHLMANLSQYRYTHSKSNVALAEQLGSLYRASHELFQVAHNCCYDWPLDRPNYATDATNAVYKMKGLYSRILAGIESLE
jgi:hypothetical protein